MIEPNTWLRISEYGIWRPFWIWSSCRTRSQNCYGHKLDARQHPQHTRNTHKPHAIRYVRSCCLALLVVLLSCRVALLGGWCHIFAGESENPPGAWAFPTIHSCRSAVRSPSMLGWGSCFGESIRRSRPDCEDSEGSGSTKHFLCSARWGRCFRANFRFGPGHMCHKQTKTK